MNRPNETWLMPWFEMRTSVYPLQRLGKMICDDKRRSASFSEAMYCTSTRRASSRHAGETGTRNKETPATKNERERQSAHCPHLNTYPQLELSARRLLHVSRRESPDIKYKMGHFALPKSEVGDLCFERKACFSACLRVCAWNTTRV